MVKLWYNFGIQKNFFGKNFQKTLALEDFFGFGIFGYQFSPVLVSTFNNRLATLFCLTELLTGISSTFIKFLSNELTWENNNKNKL